MEFAQCPHCGEEVLESAMEAHWDKKRCVQKAEDAIWEELNRKSVKVPKSKRGMFYVQLEPTSLWRIILDKLGIKKNKRVAWVWIPEMATKKQHKKYLKEVKKLSDKGFELLWMEG